MMTTSRNSMQDWTKFCGLCQKIPSDDILESLCKLRIRESGQLKTALELCDMEIHQKISVPNYQKLKTTVKRSKDQKLRSRNFDARHGRIENWIDRRWKKRYLSRTTYHSLSSLCSQGDRCSFRHETQDRADKPERTPHLLSEPYQEVEVCWRKEISEATVTHAIITIGMCITRFRCLRFSKWTVSGWTQSWN